MLLFKNGYVINGDGETIMEHGNVLVEDNTIIAVTNRLEESVADHAQVIDCGGKAILPGLITNHTHGIVDGPYIAGGGPSKGAEWVKNQQIKHLKNGHTTACSVDGFCTMEEVHSSQKMTPLRIKQTTSHFPEAFTAAYAIDGKGISEKGKHMTVEKMLEDGAIGIGEVGSGQLCAAGDNMYLPALFEERTGFRPDNRQCYLLQFGVLGRYADKNYYDYDRVAHALEEGGMTDVLTPDIARDIVFESTFRVYEKAMASFEFGALNAIKYDVPVICHHTPSTKLKMMELSKMGVQRLVAAHTCLSYELEDALETNFELRRRDGVILDIAVLDGWHANPQERICCPDPEVTYAMLENGLVDVISTDYGAGNHCSMLLCISATAKRGMVTLPKLISYATSAEAYHFPGLAPGLGKLQRGYYADILVTDYPDVGNIHKVFVNGKLVVDEGNYIA